MKHWPVDMQSHPIIAGIRVFTATNVKAVHPVYLQLAESLSNIDLLKYIKIYNGRLCASNQLSENKKKEPIIKFGIEGLVGVELLVDSAIRTIQFFSIVSSQKGYGRKIVKAVVDAVPADWFIVVVFDSSNGFWSKMVEEYPRIMVI